MFNEFQKIKNSLDIFDDKLVVGNHDTITLLGTQAQINFQNNVKSVSRLFLKNNDKLESAICNTIAEIEKFEIHKNKKNKFILMFTKNRQKLIEEYRELAEYVEQVCLFFRMQQVQLIKENKFMEKLEVSANESISDLEHCIKYGEKILYKRTNVNINHEISDEFMLEDIDKWYSRLEHKLDDLRVSRIAAVQNKVQIKMLYENNQKLLDRISYVISDIFPMWKYQMEIMLGIKKVEKYSEESEKIGEEDIVKTNISIKSVFQDIILLEKKEAHICKEMQENISCMERS